MGQYSLTSPSRLDILVINAYVLVTGQEIIGRNAQVAFQAAHKVAMISKSRSMGYLRNRQLPAGAAHRRVQPAAAADTGWGVRPTARLN